MSMKRASREVHMVPCKDGTRDTTLWKNCLDRYLKKNVSKQTVARNLGMSPSPIHNLIRFLDNPEKSLHVRGKAKTNIAHNHWSLRQNCNKNGHDGTKDITLLAQEHKGKQLFITHMSLHLQVKTLLCKAVHYHQPENPIVPGKISYVMFSRLKTIRPIQIVTRARLKDQHLWWYWIVIVAMAWVTCTSVKAPLILKGTHRF